jgi:cytochrome c oxidase cbb3-type subunit 3
VSDSLEYATTDPAHHFRWILLAGTGLIGLAACLFFVLRPSVSPPPVEIAGDPFLVSGRTIYLSRCISCHGERGRGDGHLSKGLAPPKPRDFVEDEWKFGQTAEKALAVVTNGVPGTSMGGWKSSYSGEELRAVTGYVFYLAGKPVPTELRAK